MPPADTKQRKRMGAAGEADAVSFLTSQGFRIVATNVRPLPGLARGEIDIVAWNGPVLCFVEVKTRKLGPVPPDLGVTPSKRKQIVMLADAYLSVQNLDPEKCRFDVVSVWRDPSLPCPMLTLHKDAFAPE